MKTVKMSHKFNQKLQKKKSKQKYLRELDLYNRGIQVRATNPSDSVVKAAEYFRNDLISKQTESEKKLKVLLKLSKIKFSFQHIFYFYKDSYKPKEKRKLDHVKFYIVDFFIPHNKTIIEVDGGYHADPKQRRLASYRSNILRNCGVLDIKRIKNEDIQDSSYMSMLLSNLK